MGNHCECGCGGTTKIGNRFINGHNRLGKSHIGPFKGKFKILREIRNCKCGCKQNFECKINSKKRFINGHNSRGKSNPHKGETYEQIMGKKKAKEQKLKLSIAHKGIYTGISYEQRFGIEKAKEVKKKQRLSVIKRIELNNGQCWPNYNPKACEYFKSFDEQNNTKGCYAMHGGGEYHIKELGYWPDYINFDKKLIMEYDEKQHYNERGNLKEYDRIRQEQIQKCFPDFKFERIRENIWT